MIKQILSAALIAAAALPLPAAAQTKISVGYVTATDFLPAMIAKDKGFYEKRNLDVTLTRIALAPNVTAAIVSGDLQIGMSTGPILLQAAENGLGLVAIAGASRFVKNNSIVSLVARSGQKIANAGDLRGKKVGIPGLRSFLHVMFQKWLLDNNVQLKEVNMVEAAFPQMKDLLAAGTLDATIAIEPIRSRILSDSTGFKVADFVAEVNPDVLAAFYVAKADWAAKNPQAVQAFRDSLKEGIAFALQNPAEAKVIEAKYLNFTSPVVPSYAVDITPADFEFVAKISRDLGLLRQPVDVNKLVWRAGSS